MSESWYGEVEEKSESSNNDQEASKDDNNQEANQVLTSQTIDQDYDPNGSNDDRRDDHHQLSKEGGVSLSGETDHTSTTAEDGSNCVIM